MAWKNPHLAVDFILEKTTLAGGDGGSSSANGNNAALGFIKPKLKETTPDAQQILNSN